jgi:hypothetical protein
VKATLIWRRARARRMLVRGACGCWCSTHDVLSGR